MILCTGRSQHVQPPWGLGPKLTASQCTLLTASTPYSQPLTQGGSPG